VLKLVVRSAGEAAVLTGDLIKPRLKQRKGMVKVDWLDPNSERWQQSAGELIALFEQHIGKSRQSWDIALEQYEGTRTDYIVIRGLGKVLEDSVEFHPIDTVSAPVDLRRRLFMLGPTFAQADLFHPQTRAEMLANLAAEMGIAVDQIETALFADRPAEHLLANVGQVWRPDSLIARYNLELARGVLYWSDQMQVEIHDGYKDFWRYLKLFKLMFEARPLTEGGYHIYLDGPISPFVKATTRYGRQFAAFLPALLLSEKWQMSARVHPPGFTKTCQYNLDAKSILRTHFKRSGEFDSRLEADFAADFAAKFGGKRGKWTLTREDEVILLGDTVMIPDFALTNKKDGRRVLIEIVGFWTKEYLRRKVEKVRAAERSDLLLLVYEGINLTPDKLEDIPGEVLYFKNKPVMKDVMAAVERVKQSV
jgi:predicted nuclease of restriction endonuclease-like RecB superfamily